MKTIEINRSKWVNGSNNTNTRSRKKAGSSMMLNGWDNKCCLGHICSAYGVGDLELLDRGYPHNVVSEFVPLWMVDVTEGFYTLLAEKMADVNDKGSITNEQRESQLQSLALESGVILKFTGKAIS